MHITLSDFVNNAAGLPRGYDPETLLVAQRLKKTTPRPAQHYNAAGIISQRMVHGSVATDIRLVLTRCILVIILCTLKHSIEIQKDRPFPKDQWLKIRSKFYKQSFIF